MSLARRIHAMRDSSWLRGCARVGSGIRLYGRPALELEGGAISIGDRCTVSSSPVTTHFVAGPSAVLDIGSDVSIGHGGAIAAYERVEIGKGTRIGPFVIIMDTNFHGNSGDQSVHHDCRPVIIGANCRIGSRVTITRGVSIGDGAEILAGSVVSTGIPAGTCAGGARARVLGPVGDVSLGWDSAAAILPRLVMDCLGLDSPPGSSLDPSGFRGWTTATVECLARAIEARFQVHLNTSQVVAAGSLAALASRIDGARHARTRLEEAHGQ